MTSSLGRHTIAAGVTDWSSDLAKWYAEDEEMRRRHGERLAANEARTLEIQKQESLAEALKPIADFVPKAAQVLKMKERADQKAEQRKQWAFEQAYAELDVDSQKGVEKWTRYKTKEENIKLDYKQFKIKLQKEVSKGTLTQQAADFLSDNHGGNVLRVQNHLANNAIQNVFANNQKMVNDPKNLDLNAEYQKALNTGGDALKNFHRRLLTDKLADLNFTHEVIANRYGKTINKYLDTKKNLNDAIYYDAQLKKKEIDVNNDLDALNINDDPWAYTAFFSEKKTTDQALLKANLPDKPTEADIAAIRQKWRDDELSFLVRSVYEKRLTQDEWTKTLAGKYKSDDGTMKEGKELYTEDMRNKVQQALTNVGLQEVAQHRAGLKQAMELKYGTLRDGSWQPTQSEWDTHVQKQISLGLDPEYGNKMLKIKIASQTKEIEEAAIKRLQIKADNGTLTMKDIDSEENITAKNQFKAVAQDLDNYKKAKENKWDDTLLSLNGDISQALGEKSFDRETGLPLRAIQASTIVEGYARRVLARKLADKRNGIAAGTWDHNRNITVEVSEETKMFLERETFGIDVDDGGTGSLAVETVNGKGIFPNINNYYFKQKLNIDNSEDPDQIIKNFEELKKQFPDVEERKARPEAIMSNKDLRIFASTGKLTEAAKYNISRFGLDADEGVEKAIEALLNSDKKTDQEFVKKLDLAKWDKEIQSESIGETIKKYIDSGTTSPNQKHDLKTIQFVMRHIGWDALTLEQRKKVFNIIDTDSEIYLNQLRLNQLREAARKKQASTQNTN